MSRSKPKKSTGVPIVRISPDRLTRAREEALFLELTANHDYSIAGMLRRGERTSMLFRMIQKGKPRLIPAQVVRLSVPDGSWLGQLLRRRYADKDRAVSRTLVRRRRSASVGRPGSKAASPIDKESLAETRPAARAKRSRPRAP